MTTLIWLVVLWLVLLALRPVVKRYSDPKRGASKLQQAMEGLYARERDLTEVDASAFPHLDLAFYASTTEILEQRGFRRVLDFEDRSASGKFGSRRTFLRVLTDDESMGAAIYNYQLSSWARWLSPAMRNARIVDIQSRFSDGTSLTTTNAWGARALKRPPQFPAA